MASVQELLERAQNITRTLYGDAKKGSDNELLLLQLSQLIVAAKNGVMLSTDANLRKPRVVIASAVSEVVQ